MALALILAASAVALLAGWLASRSSPASVTLSPDPRPLPASDASAPAARLEAPEVEPLSPPRDPALASEPERVAVRESSEERKLRLRSQIARYALTEKWADRYSKFSSEELKRERDAVAESLANLTRDEFQRRFDAKESEVIATNGECRRNPIPGEVYNIRFSGGTGLVELCVLPEAGFEEAYKLKAQWEWLCQETRQRELSASAR